MTEEIKGYRSIWDLKGIPSFQQFYDLGIREWNRIYRGENVSWSKAKCHSINKGCYEEPTLRLNLASTVCSEMANIIWSEGFRIEGNDEDKEFLNIIFDENNFETSMRKLTERVLALGGGAVKAYVDETNRIILQYISAEKIIPISWDNSKVNEAVFIEKKSDNGLYYTRLEFHTRDNGIYTISNRLFCSDSQDILGEECPLSLMYSTLKPDVSIENLKGTLFYYFTPPNVNKLDLNSPLGESVFAGSEDILKTIDEIYNSLNNEFKLGRRRILVPSSSIRPITMPDGSVRRYFNHNDSIYEAFDLDGNDSQQIKDLSVDLRVDQHISGLNHNLEILAMKLGLSAGSLSYDKVQGLQTATSVIAQNSKTYRTIENIKTSIAKAVKGISKSILSLASLYGIYNASFENIIVNFADSVLEDSDTIIDRGLRLLQNGVISKYKFLIDYMHMNEKQALEDLNRIENDSKNSLMSAFGND